ncbi:MAG: adenosylcobinamide-GDP ribazoletransferase [Nitrospirae bacterium]|nr:adenosylcobinamide-GDP ribazoletransferase [Nitrospirota bacterium]
MARAFEFLGIIPVPYFKASMAKEEDIGRSSIFFPLVGFIYGLILVISSLIIAPFVSKEVCGILLCLILLILSRGLHIDGLSDTFDALGCSKSIERKLEIMKDSTVGPFGVTSIIFILLLKIFLVSSLVGQGGLFYISILLFPVLGRWAIVIALYFGNPARDEGLGKLFFTYTKKIEMFWSVFITVNILGLAVLLDYGVNYFSSSKYQGLKMFIVLPIVLMSCIFWVRVFKKSFGGLTGDNLGAICEMTEVTSLLVFIVIGGAVN